MIQHASSSLSNSGFYACGLIVAPDAAVVGCDSFCRACYIFS